MVYPHMFGPDIVRRDLWHLNIQKRVSPFYPKTLFHRPLPLVYVGISPNMYQNCGPEMYIWGNSFNQKQIKVQSGECPKQCLNPQAQILIVEIQVLYNSFCSIIQI